MDFYERLAKIESGGDAKAKSKTSSATGLFQMTRGTFADLQKKYPFLAKYSWEEHANDPNIQKRFAQTLLKENEQALKGKGHEVNDLSRYLAHFAGASGADKLLRAPNQASLAQILGDKVAKANPTLAKMSIGQMKDFFANKLGIPSSYENTQKGGMPLESILDYSKLSASTSPSLKKPVADSKSLIPTALAIANSQPNTWIAKKGGKAPKKRKQKDEEESTLLPSLLTGSSQSATTPLPTPSPVPPMGMPPAMPPPPQPQPQPPAPPQQLSPLQQQQALSQIQQQKMMPQAGRPPAPPMGGMPPPPPMGGQPPMPPPAGQPPMGGMPTPQPMGGQPPMGGQAPTIPQVPATPQVPQGMGRFRDTTPALSKIQGSLERTSTRRENEKAQQEDTSERVGFKHGGKVRYADGDQVVAQGGAKPWEMNWETTNASKAGTKPWEVDWSNQEPAKKTSKVTKAGVEGKTFGEKAKNFLSQVLSNTASALNTRPEQITGFGLADPNFSIREKTPEEEKLPPTSAANRARRMAGVVQGAVIDPAMAVAQFLPGRGGEDLAKSQMEGYEDFRKQLGGEGFDASRLVGNVASPFAIKGAGAVDKLLNKTGAGLFKRGAVQGSLGGALQPIVPSGEEEPASEEEGFGTGFLGKKAQQVGAGALFGGALNKLLGKATLPASGGGVGQAGSPVERYRQAFPEANLTWGQNVGGRLNELEQKLTSMPFVGDIIKEARTKALHSQNVGMMNTALKDAGLKIDKGVKAGRELFDNAYDKLTHKYTQLLDDVHLADPQSLRAKIYGKMETGGGKGLATPEQLDNAYTPGVISQKYNQLSEAGQKRFDKIMEEGLFKKFGKDPQGNHSVRMTGEQFKRHEEDLKDTIDSLMHGGGEEREIGKMVKKALGEAYESLGSNNPQVANQLKQLNKSYAKYKTLENASTASGASQGVFTPAQTIRSAARGNRSQVARGKGLLQPEAELSQEVLGRAYPDSGTAGRLQSANPFSNLLGGAISLPLEVLFSPGLATTVLQGGSRAKNAFQGTRAGSALTDPRASMGAVRALLGPSAPESETESVEMPLARGGLARYAEGGVVQNYLDQKVAEATLAQLAKQAQNNPQGQAPTPPPAPAGAQPPAPPSPQPPTMARGGRVRHYQDGGFADPESLIGAGGEGTTEDLAKGLSNRKNWAGAGASMKRMAKSLPSVVESLGRGALASIPGSIGDINDLIVNHIGSAFPNAPRAPSTRDILNYVPRGTKPTEGAETLEDVGGFLSPLAGMGIAKAGAPAVKFLAREAPGYWEHMLDKTLTKHLGEGASLRPQIFIGPKSHAWQSDMAEKFLANEGKESVGDLWYKYGTGRDPSGNLKQEIDDSLAKLHADRLTRDAKSAPSVFDHPELFKNYPDLEKAQLGLLNSRSSGGQAYERVDRLTGRRTPHIDVNRAYYSKNSPDKGQKAMDRTALHEFQHLIQRIEGTPQGGSPSVEGAEMAKKLGIKAPKETQMHRDFLQQMLDTAKQEGAGAGQIARLEEKLADANKLVVNDAAKRKAYDRLLGEAESRLTERRAGLNKEQRRLLYPFSHSPLYQHGYDVPVEELITGGYRGFPEMAQYPAKLR